MQNCITITGGIATAIIAKNLYEPEAVMAAAYRLTETYSVEIREDGSNFAVVFTKKDGHIQDVAAINSDMHSFLNDVIDEQLRLKLEQKSGKIRELIVKHAFSPIDLNKELES